MNDQLSSDLASLRIDRNNEPPPSSGRALRWIVALSVVGATAFAGWRLGVPLLEARLFKTEVALTEISVVSPTQAQVQLTSTGYVVPQVEVHVSSKLVGRVDKANVREGSAVKRGQVLFVLDPSDQRGLVANAQARVAAARARAAQAHAEFVEVAQQRDREARLAAKGAVPQATADDLSAHAKSFEEQMNAARADVSAAQAEVNALWTNLGDTTIRAPIDGTVVTKPLLRGEVVSPGTPMAKIADLSSIVVETDVPESRLHLVKTAAPTEIVLDAYPDKRWRGEVVEVSPELNRSKATATVKVRFIERDDTLQPEMAARVSFLEAPLDLGKLKETPKHIVPASAVTERAGAKFVFVVDGGQVRKVPVTLGPQLAGGFELVDGPAPGTKVVSDPPATLADGQTIQEKSP